jgi:hypothetical protein
MFDLLFAIELTASAAIVVGGMALMFGRSTRERVLIAATLSAWFASVVAAGATGALNWQRGLGVPGLGVAVLLPIAVLGVIGLGTPWGRRRIREAPLPGLVGLQAVRVLGVSFVLLYAAHRLPAPFAPVAGWGDITVGALALPIALAARHRADGARNWVFAWNVLGVVDLLAAVGLGATSSPGPIRIFMDEPGSAIMTSLPWILIPCFLVPALGFVHLAIFHRLRIAAPAGLAA